MIRQREQNLPPQDVGETAGAYFTWGSPTGNYWNYTATAAFPQPNPLRISQFMEDSYNGGKWVYNDVYNRKSVRKMFPYTDLYERHFLNIANGISPTQAVRDYPRSQLIHSFVANDGRVHDDLIKQLSRKEFESLFALSWLPKKINITADPFNTKFSVWFILADLVQLRGLVKSLGSSIAMHHDRLRGLGRSTTAKQLANDHLMIQFGLLPTVRDLQEFVKLIKNWTKVYGDMDALLSKTRPWYSKATSLKRMFPDEEVYGFSGVPMHGGSVASIQMRAVITYKVALHYRTASYSFICPEFQGWITRLKQLMDAFGVLDPSAIWDAIPFTFVVDWFYGIGSFLNRNKPKLFPASVFVHDYCESIKVVKNIDWYASYYEPDMNDYSIRVHTTRQNYFIGSEEHTTYIRKRFQPSLDMFEVPRQGVGICSIRRVLLSAALIAQRIVR